MAALIISYVWGAVAILVVAIALTSSSQSGFNDLSTLQSSVTQQINANLSNPKNAAYTPGVTVSSTLCVHNSGTQYTCLVTASDSSKTSLSVTVAADGNRWVTS